MIGEEGEDAGAVEDRIEPLAATLHVAGEQGGARVTQELGGAYGHARALFEDDIGDAVDAGADDPGQIARAQLGEHREQRLGHGRGIVPRAERLILRLQQAVRVMNDGGAVLLRPPAAEGIVDEVGGVAAEEREVRERWTLAEEVGPSRPGRRRPSPACRSRASG